MSTTTPVRMVRIEFDGAKFELDFANVRQMRAFENLCKDYEMENKENEMLIIPLPPSASLKVPVLRMIFEQWLPKHKDDPKCYEYTEEENCEERRDVPEWDKEFLNVDNGTLFDIAMAANYLHIPLLLKYCCKMIAKQITGKTTEQIRATFNIENDFTPEEEEEIRRENAWIYD